MNSAEEQLWNYIDGTCNPAEAEVIGELIANDAAWNKKYQELLQLNAELQEFTLDEPPIAFTYNVMEAIRAEEARQPLKTAIDTRLIKLIAGVFVVSLTLATIGVLSTFHISFKVPTLSSAEGFTVPSIRNYVSPPVINTFFFLDVVAGLALLDGYLRRRNFSKQV